MKDLTRLEVVVTKEFYKTERKGFPPVRYNLYVGNSDLTMTEEEARCVWEQLGELFEVES
ncbi:MAG: hypothetical protein LBR08_11175 [Bacteroidales bacterium]|jgi:hypothetical protein|nr:hypothetical protein [Bacteroidales bacterium]